MMPTALSVTLLIAAPLLSLAAMARGIRRGRAPIFTSILGLVALVCFVVNLNVVEQFYNRIPSPIYSIVWTVFALLLGFSYGLRLPLAGGLVILTYIIAATLMCLAGEWPDVILESTLIAGIVVFFAPTLLPKRYLHGFAATFRLIGLLVIFLSLVGLSFLGSPSWLPLQQKTAERIYSILAWIVGAVSAVFCIRVLNRVESHVNPEPEPLEVFRNGHRGLLVAAALVLAANAFALVGVARNRSTPIQTMELTERELSLLNRFEPHSGSVMLELANAGWSVGRAQLWLTDDQLHRLGFSVRQLVQEKSSHLVYLALEHEGPAWKQLVNDAAGEIRDGETHLVAVDVARSADTLLARYRGRQYLIVSGLVVLYPGDRRSGRVAVRAYPLPRGIRVPPSMWSLVSSLPPRWDERLPPRYTVRLTYGSAYEPWIESLTLIKK